MNSSPLNEQTLDKFISDVDEAGGPGNIDNLPQWREVTYSPTIEIDQSLDPYGVEYCAQQIALYKEIARREIDQEANELTNFDLAAHIECANPYGNRDASKLALHYGRLSKMLRMANLPPAADVLDMGCGWGLSSEFFATLGCKVTAVDINATFVSLVNQRSARRNFDIRAIRSGFDDLTLPDTYDLIAFYECLHHAIRPWAVLDRLMTNLAPSGVLAFSGEPINDIWWRNWGLRLDALSVYCIAKLGWFESGWSKSFIADAMNRCGLYVEYFEDADPMIGPIMIGRRKTELKGNDLAKLAGDEWFVELPNIISKGCSSLWLNAPLANSRMQLSINNFRGAPINIHIARKSQVGNAEAVFDGVLHPGNNVILIDNAGAAKYTFNSDAWQPSVALGVQDDRKLSFHLDGIGFVD